MGMEVTTLSVQVKSDGIDQATKSLDNLGSQAERTEKAVDKLTNKLANTSSSFGAIKASLNELKTTMALSFPTDGANALNKAMAELSTTLSSIKSKNIKIDVGAKDLGKDSEVARKGVESLNQSLASGQNVMQMFGKELYHIRNLLGGTMLAGALVEATKSLVRMADTWGLATAKLAVFVGGTINAAAAQDMLFKSSQDLKVPMESLITLYNRLVPAMTEYGYTAKEAAAVTTTMSAALKVSGATQAEISSVMLQFSQSMAAGRLNGAEFNAVAEGAPIVLRAMTDALGVTRGELKKMAEEGLLSTVLMTEVLMLKQKEWEEQAKGMPITVGAAFDMLTAQMTKLIGEWNQGAGATGVLASSIKLLGENLGNLFKAIGVGITMWAAYSAAMGVYNMWVVRSIALNTSLATSLGITTVATTGAAGAMGILNGALAFLLANPIVLALTAIAGAMAAIYMWTNKAASAKERFNTALQAGDSAGAAKVLTDEVNRQAESHSRLTSEVARLNSEREKAKKLGASTSSLDTQISALEGQAKAASKGLQAATKELRTFQDQQTKKTNESVSKGIQDRLELAQKEEEIGRKLSESEKQRNALLAARAKLNPELKATDAQYARDLAALDKIIALEEKQRKGKESDKAARKAASAEESFENKYLKQLAGIDLFIAKQEEELELRHKLTAAEAEAVKIEEYIRNNHTQLNTEQIKDLNLRKETVITKGIEIEQNKKMLKVLKDSQDVYYKELELNIAAAEASRLGVADIERKIELQQMALVGVQETALGEQMYTMQQQQNTLATIANTKALYEKQLAIESLKLEVAGLSEAESVIVRKSIDDINNKITALDRQKSAIETLIPAQKKLADELSNAAKKNMLETGRTPGQILAEGFGEAGAAIAKMSEAYKTFGDDMAKVDKYVADQKKMLADKGQATPENLAKVEKEVADKRIQINAQMYGSLAGAAKGFFSENSKGYQAMAKAEKAFRVIELAMAAKTALTKMALMGETLATYLFGVTASTAATEASVPIVVAAEQTKALAAGEAAVPMAAQMPGPLAFVGAAAMIALLAGIGISLGGSSSTPNLSAQRQESQGTGSVFGDSGAKSESTTKALELVAKNSEISLRYNEGMLSALKNIENALTGVAKLVIRGGVQGKVGFAEGMGTTYDSSMNKVFGIGDKLNVSKSLFSVKKSVVDSGFLQAAQSLSEIMTSGLAIKGYADIETKTKKAGRTKTKINTNQSDLSKELQDQLSQVVLNIGASISSAATALGMDGESFTNTLESFVVDIGRISIQGMDAKQIQETLTNVFSKLGDDMATAVLPGLSNFKEIGEGYFETLTRVATTVATVDGIFGQFGVTFNLTGIQAVDAKMKVAELAGGLEGLSSKITSFADNFMTESEKQANKTRIVTDEFKRLGVAMIDLNADDARIQFRDLVLSFKDGNQEVFNSLLNLEGVVNDLTPAFKKVATAAEIAEQKISLQDKINQLTMTSSEYLTTSRQKELEKMDQSLRPLQERINALEDEKQALALQDKINQLTMSKQDYLILTRQKELAAMDASLRPLQMRIYAIEDEKTALETLKTSANKAMSVLEKSVTAEKTALKKSLDDKLENINYAKDYENAAYDAAKASIEAKAEADSTYYDTQAKTLADQLDSVKEYRDNVKALFDDITGAMAKLLGGANKLKMSYQSGMAALDRAVIIAKTTGQLPEAKGFKDVLDAITSLDVKDFSSMFDYQRSQLVTTGKLQPLNEMAGAGASNAELAVKYAEQSVTNIKLLADDASKFYKDELKELDENHKGNIQRLDDQIKVLNKQYESDVEYLDSILTVAKGQLELADGTYIETKGVKEAVGSFAGALSAYILAKDAQTEAWVTQISNMAMSTVPTLTQIAERTSTENQQLKDELAGMREEAAAQARAIAANTAKTAKVLSQWDGDGQPEVRNVA